MTATTAPDGGGERSLYPAEEARQVTDEIGLDDGAEAAFVSGLEPSIGHDRPTQAYSTPASK